MTGLAASRRNRMVEIVRGALLPHVLMGAESLRPACEDIVDALLRSVRIDLPTEAEIDMGLAALGEMG